MSCSMARLDGKEDEKSLGVPAAKNVSCISNYQDDIFKSEASMPEQVEQVKQVEGLKVNITESASEDETENSSSFGNTLSGDEDETLTDSEVMSKLRDSGFDLECRMREKRLTAHWKTYIQPLMWRCRWAELQIRRLLYQASKYDLQAEAISRRKHLTLNNSSVEDTCAKLIPFTGSKQKATLIERRKRKRVEHSTDTAYMAQHPLFSYPVSKKCGADVAASLNESANTGIPTGKRFKHDFVFGCGDGPVSLEFRSDDNSLEQILWKIEVLQSHLGEIKTRFKKVHDENAKDIYSADARNTNDVPTSSAQNDVSTIEREKLVQVSSDVSQLMPDCDMCDMIKNGTAISTNGEAANLIDIIECNDQLQIGISCEKEKNGHLMDNNTAKELNNIEKVDSTAKELINIEKVEIQPLENPETAKEEEQANIVLPVPVQVISISDDQPEIPKEEQANMNPSTPVPVISIADDQPETSKEEQANMNLSTPVPVISIADDQPETPKEEQANMNPSTPVPVISIADDQPMIPKEEQANMNMSTPGPVISIADDQPIPEKPSISGLTSSPRNTRSWRRGRGRGRGKRRGSRWSRRA